MAFTGYEPAELAKIEAILAGLPAATSEEVYLATRDLSPRALAAVAASQSESAGSSVGDSVAAFGATGDGVTDDTAAIQAAIDACPPGGTVLLPTGLFKTTAALVVENDLTLRGAGVGSVIVSAADSANGSGPLTAPYLTGSVLMPSTPGQDAIDCTGAGIRANFKDFGIRFHDDIMFVDTGHGIDCVNPDIVSVGHELSTYSAFWESVSVFGCDGDHYAFYMVNAMMGTYAHLRSFGGGGIYMEGEHDNCKTGNSVILHPYVWTFCGGSANSYTLKAQRQGLNLLTVIRPQAILSDIPSELSGLGITTPTDAQYMWRHIGSTSILQLISIYDPDFESPVVEAPVDFGGDGANVIVRPGGIILGPPVGDVPFAIERQAADIDNGTTVTAGAGAGVASGGTASLPFGARDRGCRIRIVSGSSPGVAGTLICHVTFGVPSFRDFAIIQGAEATATAALHPFTYGLDQNGFDVYAEEAMAPNTSYDFFFHAQKSYA